VNTPVKAANAAVDDVEIAYKAFGDGEPLVMIMGMWGTMGLWPPAVIEALSSRYRVIAFDNRGMGLSTSSDKAYSAELFAADTAGLIRALGFDSAHVFGWSLGAVIALETALLFPDRVRKLVVYAGWSGGPDDAPPAAEIDALIESPDTTAEELTASMFPAAWLAEHPDVYEYVPKVSNPAPGENLARQAAADEEWPGAFDRLPNITQPTLVISGTEDLDSPVKNSYVLAERIPNAWLVAIGGAGHGLMYQYPKSFADIVVTFLDDAGK